jgi:demethylspheroidene O-methyltransferase
MSSTDQKPTGERRLLDRVDAFVKSKVLMCAYHLDVFTLLARERLTADEAIRRLALPSRSGSILLNACMALGLLELDDGKLRVPADLAPLLIRGADQPFRMATYLIDYYDVLYADLANLDEIVKTDGAASRFRLRDYLKDDVSEVDPELAADYSAYMDATMAKIVGVVLEMYDFSSHTYLLDLCGGTGTFCEAVVRATPGLRAGFIDVPAVAEIGRERLAHNGLAGRIDAIGGDVFAVELPRRADVMTMCRSAHDWDDGRVLPLFRRVFEALPAGGKLLLIERMIPDEFTPSAAPLYLRAIYFLSKSRTACYRTAEQYHRALREAGFTRVETLDPPRDPYEFFQGLRMVVGTRA